MLNADLVRLLLAAALTGDERRRHTDDHRGCQDFPAHVMLTMWAEIKPNEVGKFTGQVRVIKDDEAVLLRGETEFTVKKLKPIAFPILRMPLEFQRAGDYLIQWKWGDEEWQTVKEFGVQKKQSK